MHMRDGSVLRVNRGINKLHYLKYLAKGSFRCAGYCAVRDGAMQDSG
jgi:hypothetical protein